MDNESLKGLPTLERCIIEAIQEKKGNQIVTLNLSKIKSAICDEFIICHGTSSTQVVAIADHVRNKVKQTLGIAAHHEEGFENAQWILLDYFDIVLHVFNQTSREHYRLEDFWADAKTTNIS